MANVCIYTQVVLLDMIVEIDLDRSKLSHLDDMLQSMARYSGFLT